MPNVKKPRICTPCRNFEEKTQGPQRSWRIQYHSS